MGLNSDVAVKDIKIDKVLLEVVQMAELRT